MPKKLQPKTIRNTTKHSSIDPNLNLKSRYEEHSDINEYFHTLPPEAKEWMDKFVENEINADFREKRLIDENSAKKLLKQYVKEIKNYKGERKVKDFVNKYLIREDNIPIHLIKDMFFEQNDKKLLKLVSKLKDAISENVKKASKREVNKIMKIMEKEAYGKNNARNRCVLTKSKAGGHLNYLEELPESEQSFSSEDDVISKIDLENHLSKLKKPDDKPS